MDDKVRLAIYLLIQLLSLSVGKFGVIFTRRQLFYSVIVLTAVLAIYVFILVEEGHNHEIGKLLYSITLLVPISAISWAAYRSDCGFDAFQRNPRQAVQKFERNYYGKGVSWDGYVIRVNVNEDDPMTMAYHSGSILIKMDLDDREGLHGADLGLSLSDHTLT